MKKDKTQATEELKSNVLFVQISATHQKEDTIIKMLDDIQNGYSIISAVSTGGGVQYILKKLLPLTKTNETK